MIVITATDLSKSFQGRQLYSDVNFTIEEGTATGLVGPNGAGKSVLLRLICGFARPDTGIVTIDARYLSARRVFPDKFGVLIDRPGYLAGVTGRENLLALARIRGIIGPSDVDDVMFRVGLEPNLTQRVRNYSLGMKQKLALAQALMESPEVLVLDEPFNALDSGSVENLKALLRQLVSAGTTLIFTSHDNAAIEELSTHTLTIADGTILASARR